MTERTEAPPAPSAADRTHEVLQNFAQTLVDLATDVRQADPDTVMLALMARAVELGYRGTERGLEELNEMYLTAFWRRAFRERRDEIAKGNP